MEKSTAIISKLMVEVFNDILAIEEAAVKAGSFNDITVTEVHTIEAIGMYEKQTMSEVAKKLNITVGTLTVAIHHLVKKGYVERFKSENDRRVVKIGLTKRGRLLYRVHKMYHTKVVKECVIDLDQDETRVLSNALAKLHHFLSSNYINSR